MTFLKDENELLGLCERGVKKALKLGSDEAEVFVTDGKETNIMFQSNDLRLGKSQFLSAVGIRVIKNGGLGFATVNSLDEKLITHYIEYALTAAKLAPPDKNNKLPEKTKSCPKPRKIYDEASERFNSEDAASHATKMFVAAKSYDPRVQVDIGSFEAHICRTAVANSRGVAMSEKVSLFAYLLVGMAVDGTQVSSFDYSFGFTHIVDEIEPETMAQKFAERVIKALGAKKCESFRGTVLLSPYTAAELLASTLVYPLNSNMVQKGMSKFAGKLGQQIASKLLTIEDNGLLPGGFASSSFDREGVPHQALNVIEKGVLKSYFYNTYTASKEGCRSTGHAHGTARTTPTINATNLMIVPGAKSSEKLISEIDKGLLVTRFSGFPEPVSGDVAGTVKGGWLIEHGEITKPVTETMIAGNIFEILKNISGLSKETETLTNFTCPYIRIENVSVTGG